MAGVLTGPVKQLIPQPHGGALLTGGVIGHVGGSGQPTSWIREQLKGSYAARLGFLSDVVDGKVLQQAELPLAAVLPYVHCPSCGQQAVPNEGKDLFLVTFTVAVSASVKDRIAALEQMAKYAIGTLKEVSVENVRDRMKATMQVIREHAPEELANRLAGLIAPLWR